MRKYISKILGFFFFIITWGVINYCINSYFIKNEITGKDCTTLIIGESHVKSGLNPEMFTDADNIAQPAESIILSYFKLKKVHGFHADRIKNVILSIGHYSISEVADIKFKYPEYAEEFIYRAYPVMSYEQINSTQMDWRIHVRTFMKNMLLYPRKKHDSYIGHFMPRTVLKKKNNIKNRIKKHFNHPNGNLYGVSETSIYYLDSIMIFCQQNDLQLYTIYIPMKKEYKENIPPFFNPPFERLKNKFKKNNVIFFDFHQVDIGDEYFSDFDHLNGKGADLVTRMLLDKMGELTPKSPKGDF